MDIEGIELSEFGALDPLNRYYKATEQKYTFSEAVELCRRHGAYLAYIPDFNDEDLMQHFNKALKDASTKLHWIGYKFYDDKLYPLYEGSTEHMAHKEMEYPGTITKYSNNECVTGKGIESGNNYQPTIKTAYCYEEKHPALCMKSCKGISILRMLFLDNRFNPFVVQMEAFGHTMIGVVVRKEVMMRDLQEKGSQSV